MKYAAALVLSGCLYAQPALNRPVLGQMLDPEGVLRPVTGVGGSFQLEPPVALKVLATSCSRELCIAKTDSAVVSGSSSTPAPAGAALLAINGTGAVLYFSAAKQLERWENGTLTPVDVNVDGEVLALRAAQGVDFTAVEFAVRRESGVWIVSADGSILDSLPSETGPVLLLPNAVVYSAGDALVLRGSGGSEIRFAAAGVTALFALGDGYVEALTAQGVYALRTFAGREALFVLPQAPERIRFPEKH